MRPHKPGDMKHVKLSCSFRVTDSDGSSSNWMDRSSPTKFGTVTRMFETILQCRENDAR